MKKTKIEPMVNLNVNPCKMCMPMGAMTAFYGISHCISILHGSQGCSTYIRRHMATHYNEPVDIASSSLTEQGTVYGGEDNLKIGLKNLIEVYHPQVIGVATTCLAETIGEDLKRILYNFKQEYPEYEDVAIIPVHSAGYGGTQYEGYFSALSAIVSEVEMSSIPNERINVITSPLSPADTRYLKQLFQEFGLDVILLPDLSDNLDGVHDRNYSKLPLNGTSIADIGQMAGAKITIELCDQELQVSPGKILEEKYHVPLRRLNLPIGLKNTDAFFHLLCDLAKIKLPEYQRRERGRFLDAMIDSHKYNAKGRAVIFGEPDFVISTVQLCLENGILPVVATTGSVCPELSDRLHSKIAELGERYFSTEFTVVDDADFKTIEELAQRNQANILIGNSDGRRMEENLKIPLVRRGFPIHDRVGGQRLRMLGYEGSLMFLDEITNALLARIETTFRDQLYDQYYEGEKKANLQMTDSAFLRKKELEDKTSTHPCYNCAGHKYARMHLPVAPACNVQCNYCVRKFDCPNESRPGVTAQVLTPLEALEKYKLVKGRMPNLTVVGIAGPGDALANFEETKKTFELIREYDPSATFCLSTNGLLLPRYAEEIIRLGVTHVTVTINAVDPKISAKIYKYINYMGMLFEGESAGALMVSNQLSGLRILTAHGIICKVNIVTLRGINEEHIADIVRTVKEIGVFITNIMPMIPVEGSAFEHLPMVNNKELKKLRDNCNEILPQMYHCKQCRADAIGTLDNDVSIEYHGYQPEVKEGKEDTKYRYAIASKSGMLVDQHFGQVKEFYIYDYKDGKVQFMQKRQIDAYCTGVEECDGQELKMSKIMNTIKDCTGVIVSRIGDVPREKLVNQGIQVITTYDRLESAVRKAVETE